MLFTVRAGTNTSDPMVAKLAIKVAKQWQTHGSSTVTITDSDGGPWTLGDLRGRVIDEWQAGQARAKS